MIHQWEEFQVMLRDSASGVCQELRHGAHDGEGRLDEFWRQASSLGWFGIVLPEDDGGSGGGLVEAGVIAAEQGRAGLFGGYAETIAISFALARGDARSKSIMDWLAEATEGRLELRFLPPWDAAGRIGDATVVFATNGPSCRLFDLRNGRLVTAALGVRAPSVRTTARLRDRLVDRSASEAWTEIGSGEEAREIWDAARRTYRCLAAAQLCGAMRALLSIAVDYSRIREQFGHPIGSYQAVQHAVTDILAGVDAAELATFKALATVTGAPFAINALADTAVAFTRETAWTALMKTYDIMGGVGFIEEHELSRYTRGMLPLIAGIGTAEECEEAAAAHVRRGMWLSERYGEPDR